MGEERLVMLHNFGEVRPKDQGLGELRPSGSGVEREEEKVAVKAEDKADMGEKEELFVATVGPVAVRCGDS